MTLFEIEKLAKEFSDARETLRGAVDALETEIHQIKKGYMPGIRRAIEKAANLHKKLFDAVDEVPDLFSKPKTVIFHGIRLGYQKAKGEIIWEDTSAVVKLIKKHFPEEWETMIKVVETPIKTVLAQLSVADLKKIGVMVTETGDQVFIKPTDSEIDKLINALLKDEKIEDGMK